MLQNLDTPKILSAAMSKGGEFADLYLEELDSTSIVMEDNKVDQFVAGLDSGAGIRVIHNRRTAYGYTNSNSQEDLLRLAEAVASAAKGGKTDGPIEVKPLNAPPVSKIAKPLDSLQAEGKVALCRRANEVARGHDPHIVQAKVVYREGKKRIAVVASDGAQCEEDKSMLVFLVQCVGMDGDVIQTGYEPIGGYVGLELFDETTPEEVAERAARQAMLMLSAVPAPSGPMTVVMSSEAGGTMVHEAVGHGLEADLVQRGLSVYQGKLGQKVAADCVTVIDDATMPNRRGSFTYDDEAVVGRKKTLIENGVLKGYMYDRLSAMKDDEQSTGNGRRESYKHKPIVRMTNTYIASGDEDPASILKGAQSGLYVRKMGGGQVNTTNGDFVFEVTEGFKIENGELGEPVRGATLTGNGPKVLEAIDEIGNDLGFAIGTCGKDGQGAPVTDAQPTLRIPNMIVGGTA